MAVDLDMSVLDELARLGTRIREPEAKYHVIEAPFEQDNQVVAGNSLLPGSLVKRLPELPLENPIAVAYFLLLYQLQSAVRYPSPASCNPSPSFHRALRSHAPAALEHQFLVAPLA